MSLLPCALVSSLLLASTNALAFQWAGLKPAANWAQAALAKVFVESGSASKHVFGHIGIFDNDWPSHLPKVADILLERLKLNRFNVNPCKCARAVLDKMAWPLSHSYRLQA
jgi:hypothetical protein